MSPRALAPRSGRPRATARWRGQGPLTMTPAAGIGFKAEHYAEALASPAAGTLVRGSRRELYGRGRPAARDARGICAARGRCRFMASACRLPEPTEPEPIISRPSSGSSTGSSRRLYRSILPGRASTAAAFPTCCRCPARTKCSARCAANIGRVQDALGRQILIENPTHYLNLERPQLERDELSRRACPAQRLRAADRRQQRRGRRPQRRVRRVRVARRDLPPSAMGEIHLAGHSLDAEGTLLIDSHDAPVSEMSGTFTRRSLTGSVRARP